MDLLTELLYSTVRLEVTTASGISVGTGFFFFALQDGDKGALLLMTNKHVVDRGTQLKFMMHLADGAGRPTGSSVAMRDQLGFVVNHPDPDVDLCGIPVGFVLTTAEKQGRPIFYRTVGKEHFPGVDPSSKPQAVEDILMIGYPNGLWDTANNMPIVRPGITATSPVMKFDGRPEFMIDAACFPGSSGSPVFMFERSALQPKPNVLIGRRFCFLGVLYAGPTLDPAGKFTIAPIPTTSTGAGSGMMHLGLVVQAEEVLRVEDEFRRLVETAQQGHAADGPQAARDGQTLDIE
jgi:hypothetical protein